MKKIFTNLHLYILFLMLTSGFSPALQAQLTNADLSSSAADLCNCAESSFNEAGLDAALLNKVQKAMDARNESMRRGGFDQTRWLKQWVEEEIGGDMNRLANWYAIYTRQCGLISEDLSKPLELNWSYLHELNAFFRGNCSLAGLLTFMEISWPEKSEEAVALKRCECLKLDLETDRKACLGQLYYEYWGYLNDVDWMRTMEVQSRLCWPN